MKVAWVCEYPAANFAARPKLRMAPPSHPVPWIAIQAPCVAAAGIELHIITVSKHIEADDEFVEDGIHFHFLKIPGIPRAALGYQLDRRRITQCLREIGPDLVHGFGTESSFGYSAVSSSYPTVLMIQGIVVKIAGSRGLGTLVRQPGLLVALLCEWVTVRRARHVICETAFAATFVHGYQPRAITHIVSTPIRDRWFDIVSTPAATPEVLFVGWVVPAKGVETLIRAFARVVAKCPGATLHIVGACEPAYFRDVLAPAMASLGLGPQVQFHGGQSPDQIAARLATAHVVALPTLMDTAPNVLAEARAAGVPVVASRVGGIPELIDDGTDGVLVPPGDADALAEALVRVLQAPDAARAMAARGRARVERDHRLATQVPKLLSLYRDVIASPAVPA